jgi:RES domain-containing protein
MPTVITIQFSGTHRLVKAEYASMSYLEELQLSRETEYLASELASVTSAESIAEMGNLPGIGPRELLYGVPGASIVNAAFVFTGPHGGRFHGAGRNAWYAGETLRTAQAEVAFHRLEFLCNAGIKTPVPIEFQDFVADFSGNFHSLTEAEDKSCLKAGPIPQCYAPGQALAQRLLLEGSNGIVYPSARDDGGTCLACFRPALVLNPRRGEAFELIADPVKKTIGWRKIA